MHRKRTEPYVFDERLRVWSRVAESDSTNNDGDTDTVEQRILDVVLAANDLSVLSPVLRQQLGDWSSHYHLSPLRANLLRPLADLLKGNTLEVGAGCGPLTRYLGELGGTVVSLESSRMRSRIAAARCRDLPNVSVFCERLEDFETDDRFDAITLIGVLDYARVLGRSVDPARKLLQQCGQLLRKNGCLIVAIENQVGLKYLAGSVEDHTLVAMHGINDTYDEHSVATFGRSELEDILRQAGFPCTELLLPLPDYKLPTSVLFPRAYSERSTVLDIGCFLAESTFVDRQKPQLPLFSLERAWRVVARNRLTPDLANSFLIVARKSEHKLPLGPSNKGVMLKHYGATRRKEWCKQLTITDAGTSLKLRREALVDLPQPELPISVQWQDEEYISGEIWSDRLTRILNKPWLFDEVAHWAAPWVSLLCAAAEDNSLRAAVPNNFLDATPFNLVRAADGQFRFFDLEWKTQCPPELGQVIFRGLYWSVIRITSTAPAREPEYHRIHKLISDLFFRLGFSASDDDFRRYFDLENKICEWITGTPGELEFNDFLNASLLVRQPLERLVNASEDISRLENRVAEQSKIVASLQGNQDFLHEREIDLAAAVRDNASLRNLDALRSQQMERFESGLAAAVRDNASLRDLDALRSQQMERFESGLAAAVRDNASLRDLDAMRSQQLERFESELAASVQANASLREQGAIRSQQLEQVESELEATARDNASLREQGAMRSQQLEQVESELEVTARDNASLREQDALRSQRLERVESDLEASARDNASLREQGAMRSQQLEQVESELEVTARDNASLREQDALRSQQLEGVQTELDALKRTVDTLNSQVDRYQSALKRKESEAENLAAQVVLQEQKLRSCESEIKDLNWIEGVLRDQVDSYNRQLRERQSVNETLKSELGERQKENDDLRQQVLDGQAQASVLTDLLAATEQKATELRLQFNNLSAEHEALFERLRGREAQVTALQGSRAWKATTVLRRSCKPLLTIHSTVLRMLYSGAYSWVGKPLAKAIARLRLRGSSLLLPANPLFDVSYYAALNADLAGRVPNLWAQYLGRGADEYRNPHPLFDTRYYLSRYPDVYAAGINPLMHFYWRGANEGRDPHPAFDTSAYVERYPDVIESGINPLLHYWLFGRADRRQAIPVEAPVSNQPSVAEPEAQQPTPTEIIAASNRRKVLVSILMPTFNTPERYLRLAIESVLNQTDDDWELCIHDDGSTLAETLETLRSYEADERIRISFGAENLGISNATNAALKMAAGTFVAMLDHDDEITPDAIAEIHSAVAVDPAIDAIYTDQAYIGPEGGPIEPFFKPDWSPEFFRGVMYVGHFLAVRRILALDLHGFDSKFDRVQDFEFMLRVSETGARIKHLPRILYYWRRIPGSVAFHGDEKGPIEPIQAAAVNAHLTRMALPEIASPNPFFAHRQVIGPLPRTTFPSIAIVIRRTSSSESALGCAKKLLEVSSYPNLKIFVPEEDSSNGHQDERIVRGKPETGVLTKSFEHIVWIDSDLEASSANWVEYLLLYSEQSGIATVAPLIVQSNGTVWHAGLVLGMNDVIGYPMQGWPANVDGYAGSLSCAREVTAVSGECMMISSTALQNAGGQLKYYATSVFDGADIGLRAFTQGRRNIVTPHAVFTKSRPEVSDFSLDRALFADRWSQLIQFGDPYYNRNFLQTSPGYQSPAFESKTDDQLLKPAAAEQEITA